MGRKCALIFYLGISGSVTGQVPQTATKLQPYCADSVSELRQVLNDGTVIHSLRYGNRFCRDSLGRTRIEFRRSIVPAGTSPAVESVSINDPIAGYRYNWEPAKMIVRRFGAGFPPANQTGVLGGVIGGIPPANGKITRSSLGTKVISGVEVTGVMTRTVYPAGSADNDRPFIVTFETWYSKQIEAMVLSTISDPRTGEKTERLDNLVPGDPDPSLFQPPADR